MAIKNFPANVFMVTLATDGALNLGGFSFPRACELAHMRILLFVSSLVSADAKLRVKICADKAGNNVLARSEFVHIRDISRDASGWLGWLRFDFDSYNINYGDLYYFHLETSGYVGDDNSSYIAVKLDYNPDVYSSASNRSFQCAFFVRDFA